MTERREDPVTPPETVEAEHEAALPRVVLEFLPAQVDARHVARGARALDGEVRRSRQERLRPGLENLRREEEAPEVFRPADAPDVDARRGERVAVPRSPRRDSQRLTQRRGAQRVQERERHRAQQRHRQPREAAAEREEDLGRETEVHREAPPRGANGFMVVPRLFRISVATVATWRQPRWARLVSGR